jgi:hypothetical protein
MDLTAEGLQVMIKRYMRGELSEEEVSRLTRLISERAAREPAIRTILRELFPSMSRST